MAVLLQLMAASASVTDTTAPTITSSATASVAENAVLSHALTADESVTWSIVGGADAADFEISGSTLRWASNGVQDFEAPADANTDNAYVVDVRATDLASNTTDQTITITVTDVTSSFDGTATNTALSGGNLIATHSNTTLGGARSTTQKNSGKYYFEVTVTTITGSASCVAILTAAGTYTNLVSNGTNCSVVYRNLGAIWSNNANSSRTLGALSNGDIIGVAVDLDNDKVWFRKAPSGNWNGQVIGSQDPENNIGGVSISNYSATTLAPAVGFGGTSTGATETMTGNFGGSAFSGAVPTGFTSGWPS